MIGKIFLLLIVILLWVGVYFYYFPSYPEYDIPDTYFQTRFSSPWFDSPKNGFTQWKELHEYIGTKWDVLRIFDAYYLCYNENECNIEVLGWTDEANKELKAKNFSESLLSTQEFPEIMNEVFKRLEEIQEYEYISTLNYTPKDNEAFALGWEITEFKNMISFTRALSFYNNNLNSKEFLENYSVYYRALSFLSQKLDTDVVWALILITLSDIHLYSWEIYQEKLKWGEKFVLKNTLMNYEFSDTMIQNAFKASYQYEKWMYEYGLSESGNEHMWSLRAFLFYNEADTMNLLKKIEYEKSQGNCDFRIRVNGRNAIGRILLQTTQICSSSQFKKEEELLQKREELIQLLSN